MKLRVEFGMLQAGDTNEACTTDPSPLGVPGAESAAATALRTAGLRDPQILPRCFSAAAIAKVNPAPSPPLIALLVALEYTPC